MLQEPSRSISPSSQRMSSVIQSPSSSSIPAKAIRHDASAFLLGTASPPRTPPRRRKDPPSSYPKSARLAAVTAATSSTHEDSYGYESHSATEDDVEDPHDLTYHPRHFPRASMVDNMVLALDQFSSFSTDPRYYEDNSTAHRGKGHAVSSSISSENDIRTSQSKPSHPQVNHLGRRNSARYAKDSQRLPSIFGEDEDSARVRIYEAQRAVAKPKKQHRTATDPGKGSATTSDLDLSHLRHLHARMGPAGNRRSQSFDFGSRRLMEDDDSIHDAAPHPVIYSGPDAHKHPGSPSLQATTLARRGSTKSAKTSRNKPSTLGTIAVHGLPPPSGPPPNLPINLSSGKNTSTPQQAEQTPNPRSGIFKRFFGSSRNTTPISTSNPAPPMRYSQDHSAVSKDANNVAGQTNKQHRQAYKDSMDVANKENIQPAIAKKPSSFFRRRKKSFSTSVAPPLPLTLDTTLASADVRPGEPSPISSLKAFMDPYLSEDKAHRLSHTSTSYLHAFLMPSEDSASTDIPRTDSPETVQLYTKDTSRLSVPDKSFATGAGSIDDGDISYSSDAENLELQNSNISKTSASFSMSSASGRASIRPVIEARSSSWHPDRLGIPPRKDSLLVPDTRIKSSTPTVIQAIVKHDNLSGSDISEYKSAPSTPALQHEVDSVQHVSPRFHVTQPSLGQGLNLMDAKQAKSIYENSEAEVDGQSAAAWLGEAGADREHVRKVYMDLFDLSGLNIVAALRALCSRLILKAESQLIDRLIDTFAKRWCDCNPNHGFKSADVVHTICYSVFLLNTDLHMADMSSKMTRNQFIKNAMQTIRPVVAEAMEISKVNMTQHLAVKSSHPNLVSERVSSDRESARTASPLGHRPTEQLSRTDSNDTGNHGPSGSLVEMPFTGSLAGWEIQIEAVLKEFYFSIQRDPLPLYGSDTATKYPPSASNNNLLSLGGLRRTPSVLSKTHSESNRSRYGDSKSLGSKWNNKGRSRQRLGSTPGFGSSRNSFEDQSSAWSPSMSSTWSKASLGKTLTSMSVDSFATNNGANNEYQVSIGFANALSQAIIREDQIENQTEDGSMKAAPLLEDESLELEGAPWAKEGILKHKCHLEGVDKRSKDRNWNDCFAVIEKGWMRLFSFSVTAKSLRTKARNQKAGGVVGGGNWQDNAEEVWKFMLRHTIASSLPPPGYSKARPHVWALSLPTGAVHLFSVGTPDIVKEFVSTANFWSARLSKEPMIGGVSSMEYGWGDAIINRALAGSDARSSFASADIARPSTQMSVRSSIEHGGTSGRPRLAGDKIHVSDWSPPQQSLLASQLMEVDQLKALQAYVQTVEEDLQKHNELRAPMLLAFSSKGSNYGRAMGNWEKKSSYLLREIVKFKNYIDALQSAQQARDKIYKMRREEDKQRMNDDDSLAFYGSSNM